MNVYSASFRAEIARHHRFESRNPSSDPAFGYDSSDWSGENGICVDGMPVECKSVVSKLRRLIEGAQIGSFYLRQETVLKAAMTCVPR